MSCPTFNNTSNVLKHGISLLFKQNFFDYSEVYTGFWFLFFFKFSDNFHPFATRIVLQGTIFSSDSLAAPIALTLLSDV